MNSYKIDILNIGLIIVSFILAVILPVRLFLFSYAVLGPLHYLTEIGWLNKRNYFSKKKSDVWILAILCLLVTITFFLNQNGSDGSENLSSWQQTLIEINNKAGAGLVFWAFGSALALGFIKNTKTRYTLIAISGFVALFIHHVDTVFILFGVLFPTIVHVSLFTALFMLYGALKTKSKWGYGSVVLFVAGCCAVFLVNKSPASITAGDDNFQMLLDSSFIQVGATLSEYLGLREFGSDYMLLTELGIKIQTLFAFCYTYHYLNWFSKTKIINWHEVSKSWLIFIGVIWIAALLLYAIDYKIAFMALFFLSMLHVFFEFPLNHLSIVGIFQEIKSRWIAT